MSQHPFHFLSQAFSYPQSEDFFSTVQPLCLLARDLGLDDVNGEEMSGMPLVELQAEYVRLFINAAGGVCAPPYASIYINHAGMLRQQGYEEALAFYAQAGLEPASDDESPDHIAHELAFVGLLLDQGREELAERFIDKHLNRWYPDFHQRLKTAEPHLLYRVLGQVTELCLKHERKEVVHE